MSGSSPLRLAVDIGGTFTDAVLTGHADRILASTKTLTTHDTPTDGAMHGATRCLSKAGRQAGEITGFIHGTTLATNALIEKRGARVATIGTQGFRDILEIAYERRYSQYDINIEKADFLVPRSRSFTVPERISVTGEVLIPLDEDAVETLAGSLVQCGAEAVAICLLHSYANGRHEQRLREMLAARLPDMPISISSEVSPEAREFERLCTTVANAYVQPLMAKYLDDFAQKFKASDMSCPILMMTAGGGMTTLETAARFPIRLVESGPAGGAILAARVAANCGLDQVLSFDMGGTTAKLCLIDGARPQTSRQFEIARAARFIKGSGMPLRIPVIEMIEIGAGGGSVARVDRLGRLTVGPQSAGSEPGPAAFGRGGSQATVSDADVVLGYIRPENFAEGRLTIDRPAAVKAIDAQIGAPLGINAKESADGISRIVDENMANAARMHAVESGKDIGPRTMIAFGGNGPLHACRVARSAGISRILVPPNPSVGSAVGFLFTPVSFEVVRSRYSLLGALDLPAINALFRDMIDEAATVVRQGAPEAETTTTRAAFMRYNGQGHEIEITLPDRDLTAEDLAPLTAEFESGYSRQFSRPVPGMEIEILNWSVRVSTPDLPADAPEPDPAPTDLTPSRSLTVWCDLQAKDRRAALLPRDQLKPGDCLAGPALITEPQTTTLVGADFSLRVDAQNNLVLIRDQIER